MILRWAVAVGLAVLCVVASDAAAFAATPTPAPYPTGGGQPGAWHCEPTSSVPAGSDCAVTSWAPGPVIPTPTVVATVQAFPQVCPSGNGSAVTSPSPAPDCQVAVAVQSSAPGFVYGLGIVVFLLTALLVFGMAKLVRGRL